MLLQSGLSFQWWSEAMRCYCFLRNIIDVMSYGHTPYQKRFGDFKGKQIPFGASVRYMAMKDGEVLRELPLGDKTREGIFVGYHCHPGGKWSGDYLVIDAQDMRHADSIRSYHARRIKDIVVRLRDFSC